LESSGPISPRLGNRDSDPLRTTLSKSRRFWEGSGKGSTPPPGIELEKMPALRGNPPPQDPGRTTVNHEMANNPKSTDIGTSIAGYEGNNQFPVRVKTGALEAGLLQIKLVESGERNLCSPYQDKKDALFLRSTLNAARALLRTTRAEVR